MAVGRLASTRRDGGFALVLVLAMLVALTMLATTVALVAQRLRDAQFERQRAWRAELAMADTRASVLHLLLTQRMTMGGLTVDERVALTPAEQAEARRTGEPPLSFNPVGNEVRLDGTSYRGLDGIDFSLRDDRLRNLLLDYQDPDDLYRLGSAEREQYLAAGLPPPSNRTLATPLELRAVLGWREALALLDDATVLDTFTHVRSAMINLNTAPARVLRSLPGVDAAAAERIVAGRLAAPYVRLESVVQLAPGIPADSELLSLYPSGSGSLRLWPRSGGPGRILHWTLTPLNDGGPPWREDYEYSLPQDRDGAARLARATGAAAFAEPVSSP